MIGPTSLGVFAGISYGAGSMMKAGADLIENLLGKPLETAGELMNDRIYAWRLQRAAQLGADTAAVLKSRNIKTRVLPPGFLIPFIEAAVSSQGDSDDLWACLLASSIESDDNQHPAFREVLRQMNRDEAVILEVISNAEQWPILFLTTPMNPSISSGIVTNLSETAKLHKPHLENAYRENLERLGLIHLVPDQSQIPDERYAALENRVDVLDRFPGFSISLKQRRGKLSNTSFGSLFYNAIAVTKPPVT